MRYEVHFDGDAKVVESEPGVTRVFKFHNGKCERVQIPSYIYVYEDGNLMRVTPCPLW